MLILLVGDTHADITVINRYVRGLKNFDLAIDAVLQAGDFGYWKNIGDWKGYEKGSFVFRTPTYVVHGNHEDPEVADPYMNKAKSVPNFFAFSRYGEITTIEKDGEKLVVFGVGGAPCVDKPDIKYPFDPEFEYLVALRRWEDAGKPEIDILLTHEAPTATGTIGNAYWGNPNNCGTPGLRKLWEAIRPKWQIGGHYHLKHLYHEDGLNHMILPEACEAAVVLDTSTWTFTDVSMETVLNARRRS